MLERGFYLLDNTITAESITSRTHFWLSRSCLAYLAMDELRLAAQKLKFYVGGDHLIQIQGS